MLVVSIVRAGLGVIGSHAGRRCSWCLGGGYLGNCIRNNFRIDILIFFVPTPFKIIYEAMMSGKKKWNEQTVVLER